MSLCLVDIHGDIEGDYDIIKGLPRNATNGDMIKALFPDAKITDHFELGTPIGNIIYIRLCKYQEMRVQQDWWNAPYKIEEDYDCMACAHDGDSNMCSECENGSKFLKWR